MFRASLICSTVDSKGDFVIGVFFSFYCIFFTHEEGKKEKEGVKKFKIVIVF